MRVSREPAVAEIAPEHEAAVARLTRVPAAAYGIHDRGVLTEGAAADVNVIDPEHLAAADAPRHVDDFPAHSSHTGLDSVEAIERLLLAAGARSRRVWVETVEHVYTEANYIDMRTTHGRNRARLALLDDDRRTRVLAELRRRLEGLGPSDYVFKGELVCSVSEKPT